jgi:chain length determinant protein (polysaccharide antigen chain regulator)
MSTEIKKSTTSSEIDLKQILHTLIDGKNIIFGFTALITIASVVYALMLPPLYQAKTSFISPSAQTLLDFKRFTILDNDTLTISKDIVDATKDTSIKELIYSKFLESLTSFEKQKEVLLDSNYNFSALLLANKEDSISNDISIYNFLKTISVKQKEAIIHAEFETLIESPFELSIVGRDPVLISNYINTLVQDVSKSIYKNHSVSIVDEIDRKLDEIEVRKKILLEEKKRDIERNLSDLNYLLEVAEALDINENNFENIDTSGGSNVNIFNDEMVELMKENNNSDSSGVSNLNLFPYTEADVPKWYSYGSEALSKEIEILESKQLNSEITAQYHKLEIQALKFKSVKSLAFAIRDKSNLVQINQASHVPFQPIKPNKKLIVLLGLSVGLFGSIIFLIIRKLYLREEN